MKQEKEKRKRAPGAGRKRDASLPEGEPLAKLQPIRLPVKMLERLQALKPGTMSAFIREAIQEKLNTTDASKKSVPADLK